MSWFSSKSVGASKNRCGRRLVVESLEARCLLSGAIFEYAAATQGGAPSAITSGPDGNIWFTELIGNKIVRMTPEGDITGIFQIPTTNSQTYSITTGPDERLWFGEGNTNKIGAITADGTHIEEWPIPTQNSQPRDIVAAPDGNLWFTELKGKKIGYITPAGSITECPTNTNTSPHLITIGPDGNLWFSGVSGPSVGRVTTDCVISEFIIPGAESPAGIFSGPDGKLWIADQVKNKIFRMNSVEPPSFSEFKVPGSPWGIAAAPDGNLWFTEALGDVIGRIIPYGSDQQIQQTILEIPLPSGDQPFPITVGPDGNLWWCEYAADQIGKLHLLSATGRELTGAVNQPLQGVIATFHDDEPGMVRTDYNAQIAWGDGATSTGRVRGGGTGNWTVTGKHTYTESGVYEVTITITDSHDCGTHFCGLTSTTTSTVTISGGTAPGSHDGNPTAAAVVLEEMGRQPMAMDLRQPAVASGNDDRDAAFRVFGVEMGERAEVIRTIPVFSRPMVGVPGAGVLDWLDGLPLNGIPGDVLS